MRQMNLWRGMFAVLLLAPLGLMAAESELTAFFKDLKTLQADFSQRTENAPLANQETATGRFYISRPDRFRWDYLQPYRQQIVSDGRQIWIYDEDLEQVTSRPLGEALGNTPALLLSDERPLTESFNIEPEETAQGVRWLKLTPRADDTGFSRIRLGFRDGQLVGMVLRDKLDQVTRLSFSRIERNRPLATELFNFSPPAGVDVFDTAE